MMLPLAFFDRPVDVVARALLGKVLRRRQGGRWLAAAIVETEAYGDDRGSHAWLGRTPSREAMWAPPGTVYMYFSRGADSLNISTAGGGSAVLIKGARPFVDALSGPASLAAMHENNPGRRARRADHKLLAGQTLLARALGLRVREWNGRLLDAESFYVDDVGYRPEACLACRRIGIPAGRDEHLMLRFVDEQHARSATQNPLTKRGWAEGVDYRRMAFVEP